MENIQEIKISKLEVNKGQVEGLPKNPRFIRDERYKALVKSIEDAPEMLKLRELLVVEHGSKFVVIGGNMRLRACKELGMETVPCKVLPADTPVAKLREYAIKDNNGFGEDDWDVLANEWDAEELQDWGVELPMDWDVEGEQTEVTEDDFDESEVTEAVCKCGEVWKLGEHRLMCGDSTNADDVARLMDGERADLCLTDPPYGIKADKGFSGACGFCGEGKPIDRRHYKDEWDNERPPKEVFDLIFNTADKAIIFGGNFFTDCLPVGNHWLVWNKHNTMPTFGDAELAWTNIKRNSVKIYDVEWNSLIGKEKERFHPTQKPIKLFADIMAEYTTDGQSVLDLFGGSGTTIIAAEQLGRKCRMMELDPHYCDVIIARWEKLTGQKAERISDG